MEQGPGARGRSETTRFEKTRIEGWYGEERYYEFARFVTLLSFASSRFIVEKLSTPVKASDSQRQDWRLTDEEIFPQVQ